MTKICFIVEELYPQDRGGIGRLMYNILHDAKAGNPETGLHVVMCQTEPGETRFDLGDLDGIAEVHFLSADQEIAKRLGVQGLETAQSVRNLKAPFLQGLRILDAVLQAEMATGGRFDYIEIPDHMGIGAVLLDAKKAGIAFGQTEIVCRIHSALSVILEHEPFFHPRSDWLAPRLEMERKSLCDADRIIAHIPAIAAYNQQHFGFPDAWMDKVEVAFPPVIWPAQPEPETDKTTNSDFVFTSRFQPFKRPELFIKAAVALLTRDTGFKGLFRLVSYGFDRAYIDDLRLSIPNNYRNRIRIETNASPKDRAAAISSGIIVQPSVYESLCMLAYEAVTAGRPVLLAKDCLAFGETSRWRDGQNCLMFDPTPEGLANVMEQALSWVPRETIDITPDPAYFHSVPVIEPMTLAGPRSITVLVGPLRTQADFDRFMAYSLDSGAEGVTITGFATATSLGNAEQTGLPDILTLDASEYQGAQVRRWVLDAAGDLVVMASPDALPTRQFMAAGQKAVRPGRAFSSNSVRTADRRLNIYPGMMPTILASDTRICPPCVMLDKQDLGLIAPFDDKEIIARMLARLARSDMELVLHPYPLIEELSPLIEQDPDRRMLGFETAPLWRNGTRQIGVDVRGGAFSGLLRARPAALTVEQPDDCVTQGKDGKLTVTVVAGDEVVIHLQPESPVVGEILGVGVKNADGSIAQVSLHQVDGAVNLHREGRNCRDIRANQAYQMRWGPLPGNGKLTLIVSAKADTVIEFSNFQQITRE